MTLILVNNHPVSGMFVAINTKSLPSIDWVRLAKFNKAGKPPPNGATKMIELTDRFGIGCNNEG
ncbi:MAG TPA: hypothetical protein VKH37_02140 [Ferruginibacter sp.]|nr:hypothetical protein [Ferruginibacter sp.]